MDARIGYWKKSSAFKKLNTDGIDNSKLNAVANNLLRWLEQNGMLYDPSRDGPVTIAQDAFRHDDINALYKAREIYQTSGNSEAFKEFCEDYHISEEDMERIQAIAKSSPKNSVKS